MSATSVDSLPGATSGRPELPRHGRREFLVFRLGENEFGMDLSKVRELRHYGTLARIKEGQRLIPGVVSLNQRVMPLVDLRREFTSSPLLYDDMTDIVVAHVGQREVCIVVDNVLDTAALDAADVQPLPHAGALIGTASWESRHVILVDVDKLLLGADGAASAGCG